MPSPKSILIDIHDKGLDPKVEYKKTDKRGRILVDLPKQFVVDAPVLEVQKSVELPKQLVVEGIVLEAASSLELQKQIVVENVEPIVVNNEVVIAVENEVNEVKALDVEDTAQPSQVAHENSQVNKKRNKRGQLN
jgi:hypothetical protein